MAGCTPSAPDSGTSGSNLGSGTTDVEALALTIDELARQSPDATVAVVVRDAETGVRHERLPTRLFHAASTMKIPVMIEVYRRVQGGELSLDDSLLVENSFRSIVDGSPFSIEDDSDDAIYERLGGRMAIRDLVWQMITVSSNLATNLLIDHIGAGSVQATSEALGTEWMRTLRGVEDLKAYDLGLNNQATAGDLATLLEAIRDGRAVSPGADSAMVEIMAAQEFNSMIPAGLPQGTRVAHKTGSITAIHHDAAIVYPTGRAPYVLVIMIEGLEDEGESAALGSAIASAVHAALRP
jgi:beta-lactamase class A